MVRKTRANKKTTSTFTPDFDSDRFRFKKNQEAYEKLNIFRSVWAKRKVVLDELDPEIRRNFERRGWLSLSQFGEYSIQYEQPQHLKSS